MASEGSSECMLMASLIMLASSNLTPPPLMASECISECMLMASLIRSASSNLLRALI
jgi:hypothetical protein